MKTYLTLFPNEALIASTLEPQSFGTYLATGSSKRSANRTIFCEVEPGYGNFNWKKALDSCKRKEDKGEVKHTKYIAIYEVLAKTPIDAIKSLYLTTHDGKTIELTKSKFKDLEPYSGVSIYKELCPVNPLVASSLQSKDFGNYLISDDNPISVPAIAYCDLEIFDDADEVKGNIGPLYSYFKGDHFKQCLNTVRSLNEKKSKTIDRNFGEKFSYQVIGRGFYICNKDGFLYFPMPSKNELKSKYYDWACSANIF